MWIDSHAHLAGLSGQDLFNTLARAKSSNVSTILNVGTSLAESKKVFLQCQEHSQLKACAGISPFDITNATSDWKNELAQLAKQPCIIAFGETGMDSTNPTYPPMDLQKQFFLEHCDLANTYNRPIILHSRGSEQEVLDICISQGIQKAVFHCYTGPLSVLLKIIARGYLVSFSGIVTFKNSPLQELVSATPLESLLIETDSPYLAPVPHRGKQNEPAFVSLVGKEICRIKNSDEEIVMDVMRENFKRVFGM